MRVPHTHTFHESRSVSDTSSILSSLSARFPNTTHLQSTGRWSSRERERSWMTDVCGAFFCVRARQFRRNICGISTVEISKKDKSCHNEEISLYLSLSLFLKDHLHKAIELKPEDPLSYYLLGRWCYAVSDRTFGIFVMLS